MRPNYHKTHQTINEREMDILRMRQRIYELQKSIEENEKVLAQDREYLAYVEKVDKATEMLMVKLPYAPPALNADLKRQLEQVVPNKFAFRMFCDRRYCILKDKEVAAIVILFVDEWSNTWGKLEHIHENRVKDFNRGRKLPWL